MDQPKLGQLIDGEAHRDAVHVAIAPVTAGERLAPGQHVGFMDGSTDKVRAGEVRIGIVDPFLADWVEEGQRFYLFLYPGTVVGLRHEWTHPAFAETKGDDYADAEAWLREYTRTHCEYDGGKAYDLFIENAKAGNIVHHGGGSVYGPWDLEDAETLFSKLSIVLGRSINAGSFEYSCGC